jgi:hypothetical protein
MPRSPNRPRTDLIQRAAATSLLSARLIARSVELVSRSIAITREVARAGERRYVGRIETLRTRSAPASRFDHATAASHVDSVSPLPLTPSRLLELAEEFRGLATTAATPESRAAFESLVFRYTALAAGYDDERVGSRMLH